MPHISFEKDAHYAALHSHLSNWLGVKPINKTKDQEMGYINSGDLILDALGTGIPSLTKAKAAMLKEACIWCLTKCEHENGVKITCAVCDDNACYSIKWSSDVDINGIFRAYNIDPESPKFS